MVGKGNQMFWQLCLLLLMFCSVKYIDAYIPECDVYHRISCYIRIRQPLSFDDAVRKCDSYDGHLADISDSDENDVVNEVAQLLGSNVYIGGQDNLRENVWRWSDTLEVMTWTNWNAGEPNGGTRENCAIMYLNTKTWNDVPCDATYPSVCETRETPYCNRHHKYSCYAKITQSLSFQDASKRCNSFGGHLPDISDSSENDVVGQVVNILSWPAYIDGQDTIKENVWRWSSTGDLMTYTNWNTGEPNGGTTENCASMYPDSKTWNDVPCNAKLRFVCEIEKKPTCNRKFRNSCYMGVNKALNFKDARKECQSLDAQLVDISDSKENDVVYEVAQTIGSPVYIDGQDVIEENVWRWTDTDDLMTYTNWNTGEPNGGTRENCAFMYSDKKTWNDVSCDTRTPFVCEVKEEPSCNRIYKGSCYITVEEALNFQDASSICQSHGGQLADISDGAENDVIYQLASRMGRSVYIDGQDTTQENTWKWVTSGASMTYTHWSDGEPNNAGAGEDCVVVYSDRSTWNDVPCSAEYFSVCEVKDVENCNDNNIKGNFDCGKRNPCGTTLDVEGLYQYRHEDRNKYVQCSSNGGCSVNQCASGMLWNNSKFICERNAKAQQSVDGISQMLSDLRIDV